MDPAASSSPGGPVPGSRGRFSGLLAGSRAWLLRHWPASTRRRAATIVAVVAIAATGVAVLLRVLGINRQVDIVAYVGLALACWIGAGGMIAPIPGVRAMSWLMIINLGATLHPAIVAVVAALAMGMGQTSYYVAARLESGHRARGHAGVVSPDPAAVPDVGPEPGAAATTAAPATGWRQRWARIRDGSERLVRERPVRTLFLFAVVPNPITRFTSATAGALGVPFRPYYSATTAGFLVQATLLVVAGQALLAAFSSLFG